MLSKLFGLGAAVAPSPVVRTTLQLSTLEDRENPATVIPFDPVVNPDPIPEVTELEMVMPNPIIPGIGGATWEDWWNSIGTAPVPEPLMPPITIPLPN